MANQHIAYCNLPLCVVQHWTCTRKLNGTLAELVKFLAINYRTKKRLLNLLVELQACDLDQIENNAKKENILENINK